jgi:hypothetical protein
VLPLESRGGCVNFIILVIDPFLQQIAQIGPLNRIDGSIKERRGAA